MDQQEYLITFYSIVVGMTASKYLQGWGDLIKDRNMSRDATVTVVWSVSLFVALLNVWLVEYERWEDAFSIQRLLVALVEPFGLYVAGVLLFPRELGSEEVEDYHVHFLAQKTSLMVVLLILMVVKWAPWDGFAYSNTRKLVLILLVPHLATLLSSRRWVLYLSAFWVFAFWVLYAANLL